MRNRIVACAYHNVGFRCLEELLRQGADIRLIFTHEDNPAEEIWFASVKEFAETNAIPCITGSINEPEHISRVREIAPDFLLSFYYRTMLKTEVLNIPGAGAINLHGSYLPAYRGRVPVNWAVINGENTTGATLHYMVEKPDAGDIVDQERVAIAFTDTAHDVFRKVTETAVTVLARTWPKLIRGTAARIPMNLAAGSYFGGRKPADGRIDWTKSAVQIYNLIRGVTHPFPGAFTTLQEKPVIIWKAWPVSGSGLPGRIVSSEPLLVGTGYGLLEIRSLQLQGAGEISAAGFTATPGLSAAAFV